MLTTRHIRDSGGDRAFNLIINMMGLLALFVTAYPLYFVVIASFSDPNMVASGKVWFYPRLISLKGYQLVFADTRVWIGYRNTIFYTITGTLINLLLTLPVLKHIISN